MLRAEVRRDPAEIGSTGRDRQRQLVRLAGVPDVGEARDGDRVARHAFRHQSAVGLRLELAEAGEQKLRGGAGAAGRQRPHELVLDLREQQTRRAEHARRQRHQHAAHLERARDRDGDHRPVAAEPAEHELARVAAAIGRDRLDRPRHRRDRQLEDAVGGLGRALAERLRDGLERPCGGVGIQLDGAAGEVLGAQVAEDDQRVGQRRLVPAEAVAGRPRIRARALGADVQHPELVRRDEAAAAGADLGEVDEREPDRVAAALDEPAAQVDPGPDLVLRRLHRQAVLEDRRLRRRPAHVERDHVGDPGLAREKRTGDDSGGRPRLDQVRRLADRGRGAHQAAARLHDLERRRDPRCGQARLERADVALDDRADVGVDDGRARALVLADLGEDVGRARDVDVVSDDLPDDLGGPPLVGRVRVGVEEADRHRRDALGAGALGCLAHRALVQLGPLLAPRAGSLRDLEAQPARDERPRLLVLELVHDRDPQPAHLEDVAKARRGQQAAARSLALEDGVRGDGGGVDDLDDAVGRRAGVAQQLEHALDDAARVVVGRRQHLSRPQRPVGAEQHDVRERPADVDADAGPEH